MTQPDALSAALDELRLLRQDASQTHLQLQQQKLQLAQQSHASNLKDKQHVRELEQAQTVASDLQYRLEEERKGKLTAIEELCRLKDMAEALANEVVKTKEEHHNQISEQRSENEHLKRDLEKTIASLNLLKEQTASAQSELEQKMAQERESTSKVNAIRDSLQEKVENLLREKEEHKKELERQEHYYKEEIKNLERIKSEEEQQMMQQVEKLQLQVQHMEQMMQQKFESISHEQSHQYELKIKQAEIFSKLVEQKNTELVSSNQDLTTRIAENEIEIQKLKAAIVKMKEEIGIRNIELLNAQDMLKDAAETMKLSDNLLKHWEQRARVLAEQQSNLRKNLSEVNAAYEIEKQRSSQIARDLSFEIERLTSTSKQKESSIQMRENEWSAKLEASESECHRLRTESQHLQSELKRLQVEERQLLSNLSSVTAQEHALKLELHQVESRLSAAEVREKSQRSRTDGLLAELGEVSLELQREAEAHAASKAESARTFQRLRDEIALSKEELRDLVSQIDFAKSAFYEVSSRCEMAISNVNVNNDYNGVNATSFPSLLGASPMWGSWNQRSSSNTNVDQSADDASVIIATNSPAQNVRILCDSTHRAIDVLLTAFSRMKSDFTELKALLTRKDDQIQQLRFELDNATTLIEKAEKQQQALSEDLNFSRQCHAEAEDALRKAREKNEVLLVELQEISQKK